MNTIASRDQFKPIKIEENFLVSYDGLWKDIQSRLPFKMFLNKSGYNCSPSAATCRAESSGGKDATEGYICP